MGIKGRRKRLRERETREQERLERGETLGDDGDGGVIVMGDGPYQPPVDARGNLRIKKSELFKMQDLDYLDRIRDEHTQRKTSHLRNAAQKRRLEDDQVGEEAAEIENELLVEHQYDDVFDELDTAAASARQGRGGKRRRDAAFEDEDGGVTDAFSLKMEKEDAVIAKRKRAGNGASFGHLLIGLNPEVVAALAMRGFEHMTSIQERTIPLALDGYDILGQARTGSGKSLAFCVPVLHAARDLVNKHPRSTLALMLAPTKELCLQTHDVLKEILIALNTDKKGNVATGFGTLQVQLITGGTRVKEERKRLTSGASIVVGTPGRIHDHVLHCGGWELAHIRFLVLDEADRMLADGFQRNLDAIVARLPRSRQTFLFSATNSKSVHELARLSLSRMSVFIDTSGVAPVPIKLEMGSDGSSGGAVVLSSATPLPPYRNYGSQSNESNGEEEQEDVEEDYQQGSNAEQGERDEEEYEEDSDHNASDEEEEEEEKEDEMEYEHDGSGQDDANEEEGCVDDAIPSTLRQFCQIVPCEDRLLALYAFVKRIARVSKAMIFCSTVASTNFHFQMMGSVGFHDDVMMLHGHMKHRQRVQAFRVFNDWTTGVLFCTDVAARGLDIPNVEWILQYDPPLDPTEYIHRIGRTARAGNVGNSLLFLTPEESRFVRYLHGFGIQLAKYPAPAQLPRIQEKLEHVLQLDPVVAKSAVTAYRAHVGAYQSHILKQTFDVRRLDLERLASAFALTSAPHVSLPKNTSEEKKQEYVKGKLKSLNRRRLDALKHYESVKTRQQWDNGHFVGISKPSLH